jgi:mannose-6-phosphate isomerase class I
MTVRRLARGAFNVDVWNANSRESMLLGKSHPKIVGVVEGKVTISNETLTVTLRAGEFCLVPARLKVTELWTEPSTRFLVVQPEE